MILDLLSRWAFGLIPEIGAKLGGYFMISDPSNK